MNKKFYYAGLMICCFVIAGCSDGGSSDGVIATCDLNNGGHCPDGLDCVEGSCLRPIQAGGSCISNDTYCVDGTCTGGRCVASSGGNEEPCGPENPCAYGYQCRTDGCHKESALGEACSDTGNICAEGTCIEGKCQTAMVAGQACDTLHVCNTGFDCHDGVCLRPISPGASCKSSLTYCKNGKPCTEGICPQASGGGGGSIDNPTCIDTDGDGIADEFDRCDIDTDNDGVVDCLDLDSDGDTVPDEIERIDAPCEEPADSDFDGTYDFLDLDSDNNGIPDREEGVKIVEGVATYPDTDNDTIPDSSDLDNDNDGTYDTAEIYGIVNPKYAKEYNEFKAPRAADCNGDGMPDEPGSPEHPFDCDNDTIPDYMSLDSDGDTILDMYEQNFDSDSDGYFDRYEQDSDADGISDHDERGPNAYPMTSLENKIPDYRNPDIDEDGLLDGYEVVCTSMDVDTGEPVTLESKFYKDTDGDGFNDLSEYNASIGSAYTSAQVICDPLVGVTQKTDCDECKGIFKFYFELPYFEEHTDENDQDDILNFKPAVSQLDVMFNLDTTQSMGAEVKNIQEKVRDTIIPQIKARVENSAFGVSSFDDFPTHATKGSVYDFLSGNSIEDGYGRADIDKCPTSGVSYTNTLSKCDTPYQLLGKPLTATSDADMAAIVANVNKLKLHNGGDYPEAGYESLWQLVKGDDKTEPLVSWYRYGSYSYFADGTIPRVTNSDDRWGGAGFRNSTFPVVIHITDTTSHDGNECLNKVENNDNIALTYCTTKTGGSKQYIQPYDPAYVENTHNSDDVHAAYLEKGARIISIYRNDGSQLSQLVDTSKATQTYVPVCAFKTSATGWKCGSNLCCTGMNPDGSNKGIAPTSDGQCVLSYGITTGTKLSDTLVDGVDALVKYATSNVAAVVRGNPIEGTSVDTSCFIQRVEAFTTFTTSDAREFSGYVAPPQEPEASCNPKASPAAFKGATYNNGYQNFAIGTSSSAKPGSQLNFRVVAQNNCVPSTETTRVFNAYIDIIDPTTGLNFGTQEVSIVVPGVKKQETIIY
ncbi:MAG: hypothetical protein IIY06_04900, partial [Proteobacteria bacterium]|nr:hypothetical protein [Pseudomonadota bacterium]